MIRSKQALFLLALGLAPPVCLPLVWIYSTALGGALLGLMAVSHAVLLYGTLRPNNQMFGPVVTGFVPERENEVWLTIDDGPDPADTPRLLDLLDAHDARATFFVRGDQVRAYPHLAAEIVRRGHGLSNHTFGHPQATFWCLGPRRMRWEIDECNAAIYEATGVVARLFRAPVGMVNPFVHDAAGACGKLRVVGWSARGFDGVDRHAAEPTEVVRQILRTLRPGGIALLHEGRRGLTGEPVNVRSLKLLLGELRDRGWRAVVPDETRLRCASFRWPLTSTPCRESPGTSAT